MGGDVLESTSKAEHRQGHLNGTISEESIQIYLTHKHHNDLIYCVATNRIFPRQTYESQAVELDVQYVPIPIDEEYNRKVAVSVGETAALQCKMKGNPSPIIQWYDQHGLKLPHGDNGRHVKEETRNNIQKSRLNIEDVSRNDYGRYYCRGRNKHGYIEALIVLSGKSTPDAVSNIKIGTIADVVTVKWTSGFNGGSDQKFYVEYVKLPEGVIEKTGIIDDNELGGSSVNISGLVEGSRYNITVVSINEYGETRSRAFTFRTGEHMKSSHSYESINDERRHHSATEIPDNRTPEPGNFESIPLRNIVTRDEGSDRTSDDDQTSHDYTNLDVRRKSETYMKPGKFIFEFPRDRLHITESLRTSRLYRIGKAIAWFIDDKDGPSDVVIKTEIGKK
ncbi:protein turtle-like [Ptychodera flava]|uniref:protein turtle-like n=1 Tax=Ptychodera flava TaxID=63121 RepID=UPI00396A2025